MSGKSYVVLRILGQVVAEAVCQRWVVGVLHPPTNRRPLFVDSYPTFLHELAQDHRIPNTGRAVFQALDLQDKAERPKRQGNGAKVGDTVGSLRDLDDLA